MKIIRESICYPKSEGIIIPANSMGQMNERISQKVIKDGFRGIETSAKEIVKKNPIEVGGCFSTYPGRLNRRGVKKIYHAVIKRFKGDFTSIHLVKNALESSIKEAIKDKLNSVSICGIGVEKGELDVSFVAYWTIEIVKKYEKTIDIKIVDDNEIFINEINKILEKE